MKNRYFNSEIKTNFRIKIKITRQLGISFWLNNKLENEQQQQQKNKEWQNKNKNQPERTLTLSLSFLKDHKGQHLSFPNIKF